MENSRIEIQFTGVQNEFDAILFNYNGQPDAITEVFTSVRSNVNESTIGFDAQSSANNFYQALLADYGNSGLYAISINGSLVIVVATQLNVVFAEAIDSIYSNINVTILNQSGQVPPINIDYTTFSTDVSNPSVNTIGNVNTSRLAVEVDFGSGYVANTLNPFVYTAVRGTSKTIKVKDSNGNIDTESIKAPAILNTASISIVKANTPSGANVTINIADKYFLYLEYSLNGSTWQSSNQFNGVLPGNYTAYVRDQFTVVVNKPFSVTIFVPDTSIKSAFSFLSKTMSIRFKRNQVWNNVDIYKTDENTLSYEENVYVPHPYVQPFKAENIITTQFLSNYSTISAGIVNCDGTKVSLPVTKKKTFLDLTDKRDARLISMTGTQAGIYFTYGNMYDYITGAVIGQYDLNGALPEYGVVGNYVNLTTYGWFEIVGITYNEEVNADVLLINFDYNGSDVANVVSSKYNQANYNVYEFTIDMAARQAQAFQVEILQSMSGYPNYNYLSETIEVGVLDSDYFEFQWKNLEDSYVFYSTGIKNLGNFPILDFVSSNDTSMEIHKTNRTAILIESKTYEHKKFESAFLPTEIAMQLLLATQHGSLCINKVTFTTSDTPELAPLQNTNLYTVSANLIKLQIPPNLSTQPT